MREFRRLFLFCFVLLIIPATAAASVRLPAVIDSNMVLQRGIELNIWGWADPGEKVEVVFRDFKAAIEADDKGNWSVKLPSQEAGGPFALSVTGENSITLENILIGEVWVCSGQSNMEKNIGPRSGQRPVINWVHEIESADYPQMRLFRIPRTTSGTPVNDVHADWKVCSPETIRGFSATAYFFGRHVHRETGVPIGLIMTCWGGTRSEPWTAPSGFAQVEKTSEISRRVKEANREYSEAMTAYLSAEKAWEDIVREGLSPDQRLPKRPLEPAHPLNSHREPTGLYNAMIAPITQFGIRGAIWYQGEGNRNDRLGYADKMEALIKGWRTEWKQGDFPFYLVQLAPFDYEKTDTIGFEYPEAYYLPETWMGQFRTLRLPNTGMAVTTDITELYDIHPTNKQDVGKRLALWALAKDYGQEGLVYSGPLYKGIAVEGSSIKVSFDHVGSGLASNNGEPLNWFEIAGADGEFVRAKAVIEGDQVVVSCAKVEKPEAVRFGWHELAVPNLANKEGLPASPFNSKLLP